MKGGIESLVLALSGGLIAVVLLLGVISAPGAASAAVTCDQPTCTSVAGPQVAAIATEIASHLQLCGPYRQDRCYGADMPANVLAYLAVLCPSGTSCWGNWQSGNFQCVMLIVAAYGLAGDPLPARGNAIDYWSLYQDRVGWMRVPDGAGSPAPGDMVVWDTPDAVPDFGHIAIVTAVDLANQHLTIAEANGPGSFLDGTLDANGHLHVNASGYPLGYIRHVGVPATPTVLPATLTKEAA